jgi:hypothetical protein
MQVAREPFGVDRGGRVRNTWLTCPTVGDNLGKPRLIPHELTGGDSGEERRNPLMEGAAAD